MLILVLVCHASSPTTPEQGLLSACCRFPHEIKGEGIYAYVTLEGSDYTDAVKKDLVRTVREQIGAFAAPDVIHWAPGQRSCPKSPCMLEVLASWL